MKKFKSIPETRLYNLSKGMKKYGMVAFSSKQNAENYAGVLRTRGFSPAGLRTFGPTLEEPNRRVKAYTVFRGPRRMRK